MMLTLISGIFILTFSTFLGYLAKNSYMLQKTDELKNESKQIANDINKELELYFKIINTTSQNLSSVADPTNRYKINRQQTINLLNKTIEENYNIVEFYTVWEKNLFDNSDSLSINQIGSDSIGRFCPAWKRLNTGKIEISNFDYVNKSSYYINTKDRIINTMPTSYIYRNNAKKVLKQPMISPILFGNKFLGIVGIEISTDWVQNYLDKLEITNKQIAIIANDGTIIAVSGYDNFKGSFLTELFFSNSDELYFEIKKGVDINKSYKKDIIIGTPFYIGETEISWNSIIIYPTLELNIAIGLILASFWIGAIILIFIVYFIFRFYLKNLLTPLEEIINYITYLQKGELNKEINITKTSVEFNKISEQLTFIRNTFYNIKKINENIIVEDFTKKIKLESQHDILRTSINNVLNKLDENKKKLVLKTEIDERSNWVKQGIAHINESIRINSGSIDELSDVIVSNLSKYMNSLLCGLFIYKESPEGNYLETISTYAYDIKKSFKTVIKENEGLVGTCAVERKKIYITKVPENYISISSGLGVSSPKSLLLLPLEFETEFLGIIELAFFRDLEEYELEFAEHTIKNIASAIKTVKISLQTTELLEKSQQQTEQLAKKEKELLENLEKQKTIQKQSEQNEAELKSLINAVNNSILTVEYQNNGTLISANDKYLNAMHYTIEEITGDKSLETMKDDSEELKQIIVSASKGNFITKTLKRYTKYGDIKWLLSSFTPFYNSNKTISKILFFGIDITDNINKIEQLEKTSKLLNNELELLKLKIKNLETINEN